MLLAHLASPAAVDSLEADKGGLLYKDEPHQDNWARILGRFSQRSFTFRPSLSDYTLLQSTRDARLLGIVFLLKTVLGNLFMTWVLPFNRRSPTLLTLDPVPGIYQYQPTPFCGLELYH